MLPMMDLGAVMLALEEHAKLLDDGTVELPNRPLWVLDKLIAIKAVQAKLPEKPPEERQVVWLQGG